MHSPFIDNILGADFGDMQLISKSNKGFWFVLCVINICSTYVRVIPLKDKKKELPLLMLSKKSWINQVANQIKYGQIKAVNFTIDQWDHGLKQMI